MDTYVTWVWKVSIGKSHVLFEGTVPPFATEKVIVGNARVVRLRNRFAAETYECILCVLLLSNVSE